MKTDIYTSTPTNAQIANHIQMHSHSNTDINYVFNCPKAFNDHNVSLENGSVAEKYQWLSTYL